MKRYKKIKKKLRKYWRTIYLTCKHFATHPDLSFATPKTNTVIFCVNGWVYHGGWTDRLKGLISTYEAAKQAGKEFKVWYSFPRELSDYLLPNKVNWSAYTEDLRFNPLFDSVIYAMEEFDLDINAKIAKKQRGRVFVYSNVDFVQNPEVWRHDFHELFQLSEPLKVQLSQLIEDKPRIGIHIRVQNRFGDFEDGYSMPLPELSQIELVNSIVKEIGKLIYKKGDVSIYLFGDSKKMQDKIYLCFPNLNRTIGDLEHIDTKKSELAGCNSFTKLVFDFFLLSMCHEIYSLTGEGLYNSAFPLYASYVGINSAFKKIKLTQQ